MATIRPIRNGIIFQFEDEVNGGMFSEETEWGFALNKSADNSTKEARWGIVVSVGDEVEEPGIIAGARVLIEPLAWTEGAKLDEQTYWKTDETKIMAIDES